MDFRPNTDVIHGDINCELRGNLSPITLFAYRPHTHAHGTVITGYRYRDNNLIEIARGNPQKPQTFYPMQNKVTVRNGDFLAARCTFNTTLEDGRIYIGIVKILIYYLNTPCYNIAYKTQNCAIII